MKECPANWHVQCETCPFSKDGLCDYPYIGDMKVLNIVKK